MTVDVVIVGSGFSGLGAAIQLTSRGVTDVVILERADDLGGTWRDNRYPGCRCDVSSNLYSLSFAPNPNWSNSYSYQPEIWQYLQDVADQHHLRELIRFQHDVTDISFDDTTRRWRLTTASGATIDARHVILATGGLAEPRFPEIAGLEEFAGPIMHTAQWDDGVELTGKRVGVIGTGASAIQVVPQIAPVVAALTIFQRTPSWVLPHLGHPVRERTRHLFRALPFAQRLVRLWNYWQRELLVLGFVKDPQRMSKAETMSRDHLVSQVASPELRAALTPTYRLGCKRVLISNDFYPALERDNVTLVTSAIERIESDGVRTADGVMHPFDVLITATGFFVTNNPVADKVHGANGVVLARAFHGALSNFKGTMFPGFPNFYMLGGPNTALGHSSVVFMMESQLNYVCEAIALGLKERALLEPRADVAEKWSSDLQSKLVGTVWDTGCSSWYLNEAGVNTTIWPDFTFRYRSATRKLRRDDHRFFAEVD